MFFQAIHNAFNDFSVIAGDTQVHAGRERGKYLLLKTALDLGGNGHGIRTRDPNDPQTNTGLPIEPRQLAIIRQPVLNPGYIAQLNAASRMFRHHHIA